MKAVFISFYQAFYNDMLDILDKLEIRGFTYWPEVQGRGSVDGEPHYGTHAWPTLNAAILTFVADDKVKPLMEAVHQLDETAPRQGLRAFILQAEEL
ncbi:MAG: hypothetical protein J6T70_07485 [Bacteroidales bacterium]|nr:hypothetical protein [Bacteroidales bacterium]